MTNSGVVIARPWQPKVVKDVLDLVKSGKSKVILNAPTGSGKTKIALDLIREIYRELGLESYVAVRTMNEMVPYDEAVAKFRMGLVYRYMIGKRRGCAYYTEGDDANSRLCDACLGRETIVEKYLDEYGEERKRRFKVINEENARRVIRQEEVFKDAKNGLSCLEEKYVKKDSSICLYHSLKQIPSHFILMSYPYLLNKGIRQATNLDFSNSLLIVDEAHNLEGAVGFSHSLSSSGIDRAGKEFLSSCLRHLNGEVDVKQLGTALSKFSKVVTKFSHSSSPTRYENSTADLEQEDSGASQKSKLQNKEDFISAIETEYKQDYQVIREAFEKIEDVKRERAKAKEKETLRNPFFGIVNFLNTLNENLDEYELFSEGKGNLSIKLLDPAPSLQILKQPKILVMMSGTMPSSDYVEKVWGVEGCSEISVLRSYSDDYYSVFGKESHHYEFLQDQHLSTAWGHRRRDGLWQRYAEIIDAAFEKESKLSLLVCAPSYWIAETISSHLRAPKFLEDRQTPISEVKNLIVAGGRRVVVAVARGKLLEGIELVEDGRSLIDCVVIAGIPYPVPDDVYKLRFAKVTQRLGIQDGTPEIGQFEREYFRHQPALMTVKQAIGRAVRYPEDRARIILADNRYTDSRWKSDLVG
ncbi:MAG: DEAD/DEAH box helicase family protein [Nitrososphaerota archaeon]|nr:DEAD/DEAH box helicase family protein [Nitrososphaerota archaeon]